MGVPKGEGPETADWLSEEFDIPLHQIETIDYDPAPEAVDSELRAASVLLMPSRAEGFGLVALEAVERGVPVLVSDRSGMGDFIAAHASNAARLVIEVRDNPLLDTGRWGEALGSVLADRKAHFTLSRLTRTELAPHANWELAATSMVRDLREMVPPANLEIASASLTPKRERVVDTVEPGRTDRGLTVASAETEQTIVELTDDELVNTEKTRLVRLISQSEADAEYWQQGADLLDHQQQEHSAARAEKQAVLDAAQARYTQTRTETLNPLTKDAASDGQKLDTARQTMWAAHQAVRGASRLERRNTQRTADQAQAEYRAIESRVQHKWGSIPMAGANLRAWIDIVAARAADTAPLVVATHQEVGQAKTELDDLVSHQLTEQVGLRCQVYGSDRPGVSAKQQVQVYQQQAEQVRTELAQIETMPLTLAAQHIKQRNTDEAERTQREAKQTATITQHMNQPTTYWRPRPPGRKGPGIGL
jgi:hypothetical protein